MAEFCGFRGECRENLRVCVIRKCRFGENFPGCYRGEMDALARDIRRSLRHASVVLTALALACLAASCSPLPEPEPIVVACSVTDGDTIRCGEERIRLLGIDAPELPGHCRAGRTCVEGDGAASTRPLAAGMQQGPLSIVRLGQDRYGRTLALVLAGSQDLSCWQIGQHQAEYVARWDNRRAVARSCPDLAR